MPRIDVVLLVFCVLAASSPAQDDRVKLKSGAEFVGRIVSEQGGVLKLSFPGGVVDLRAETIAEIVRGGRDPAAEADAAVLAGLNRLPDGDDWFFLYRDGVRTGWRHVKRSREIRDGVAGYLRTDRRVFTKREGGAAEVDVSAVEFVDADLRPRAAARRLSSGQTARTTEGRIEDGRLTLTERVGADRGSKRAPCDAATELPGFLYERMAREPRREAAAVRVFDPSVLDFAEVSVSRSLRRVSIGGRVLDVVVLKRRRGAETAESWFDLYGRPVREELQGTRLVAVRADPEKVRAFAAGEKVGEDDLGLRVEIEAAGVALTKPDGGWEAAPGDPERFHHASLVRAGARASCELFVLPLEGRLDEDAACLDVMSRVEASCERAAADGPERARYGQNRGVKFTVDGVRRGTLLRTLGFVTVRGDRVFVFLCAAPASQFGEALPAFERLLSGAEIADEAPAAPPPPVDLDA
jgi:hypothetical protein